MNLLEIIQYINQNGFIIALVMLILSCMKLPKYELNIWQLFIKNVNKETNQKLDSLDTRVTKIQASFDQHIKEDVEDEMDRKRRTIINFSSEITRHIEHTEEQFNQIIEDIDKYEQFCDSHPDYHNTKAVASIKNIKHTYEIRLQKNDFLR